MSLDSSEPNSTLSLVSKISKKLLEKGQFNTIIDDVLSMLGESFDIDRVYIFKNRGTSDGKLFTSYYLEWARKGVEQFLDNESLSEVSYDDFLPTLQSTLASGNNFAGKTKELHAFERTLLEMQGIKSILIVPILFEGVFWGFVGFDDCKNEREWSNLETSTLTVSANMISGYVIRGDIQEKLLESENRLYKALESSSEGVWDFDTQKRSIYLSDEGKRILGITHSKRAWLSVDEILRGVTSEYKVQARAFMAATLATRENSIVFEFKRSIHRQIRWFRIKGAIVAKNKLGQPARIIGTFSDITDNKMSELRLVEALNAAENANKAKSSFLATMSHEIRTPLNGMIGFLKLLFEHITDETGKEYLKIVDSSADSLMNIINSILDISKVESGSMLLESVETRLSEELESIAKLFSASAYEKGLYITTLIDPSLPAIVKCDKLRIRQILSNLLNNALKFTARGGFINLYVKVIKKTATTVKIKFLVSDNGVGISKDSQKDIFSPFVQADSSIARKFGGSGLGLTIAHRFVVLMGGNMELESDLGLGANFSFELTMPYVKDSIRLQTSVERLASISIPQTPWNFTNPFGSLAKEHLIFPNADTLCASGEKFDAILIASFFSTKDVMDSLQNIRNAFPDTHIVLMTYPIDVSVFDVLNTLNIKVKTRPVLTAKLIDYINNLVCGNLNEISHDSDEKQAEFMGKVLIVEDNLINSKLISIVLKRYGIIVVSAMHGLEALEKFDNETFDMILMDVNMPVMDGMTATREIRKREKAKHITPTPIYALTANVMKSDTKECIASGMNGVLCKPIETTALEAAIAKCLKRA